MPFGRVKKRFSFEEKTRRKEEDIERLKKKRVRAESFAKLSKQEKKERQRIRAAKAATKSGSPDLAKWGRRALKEAKPLISDIGRLLGEPSSTRRPRRSRRRKKRR